MNDILFFATPNDFRNWLAENYDQHTELWVGYYKKSTKKASITWPESVDQALCYGWIDGIRKSVDEESYKIRFTPRRPNSVWSAVNLKKMKELIAEGLMEKPGLEIYEKRKAEKEQIYAYEQKQAAALPEAYEKLLKANEAAWAFFEKSAPYYKRQMTWWIISAKKKATQINRLNKLIEHSAEGKKVRG